MNRLKDRGGRPPERYSRRRYAIAVAALNRLLKNDKQLAVNVLRATELLLAINGMSMPTGVDTRLKRSVKELVTEGNMERLLRLQVDAETQVQIEAEREPSDALTLANTSRMFDSVLVLDNQDQSQDEDHV